MTNFKKQFCRLCLSDIADKNFTIIEDNTKDIFDLLLLKNEFPNGSNISCSDCWRRLFAAFEFKTMCLHSENTIKTHVYCSEKSQLDILDIYMKEIEDKRLVNVSGDQKVCRLCLELISSEFVLMEHIQPDILQTYFPEMNFDFTKDPVACKICFDSLLVHVNFINETLKRIDIKKEEISMQTTGEHVKTRFVKFEEVLVKIEECEDETIQMDLESELQILECKPCDYQIEHEGAVYCRQLKNKNLSELKIYKCDKCRYQTICINKFATHELTHRDTKAKTYKCYQRKHRRDLANNQIVHGDTLESEMFKCKTCAFQTKYKKNLIAHELQHGDVKTYKCDECDHRTKYRRTLLRHQLTHRDASEVKLYKCDKCDHQTKHKTNLAIHQLTHKDLTDVEAYKCTLCDFQTKYKGNFFTHQLRHKDISEVRLFKCEECDFQTKYKNDLTSHQLLHRDVSEVKMYKCETCDYQTKHKKNFSLHQLKHRDPSEVIIYECEVCHFQTRYKNDLQSHLLTHKDVSEVAMYRCGECDFQTKRKKNLSQHQLKHRDVSEVAMFNCGDCDFRTKYKSALSRHQILHRDASEVKLYRCEYCDHQTKHRTNLVLHRLKHRPVSSGGTGLKHDGRKTE